MPIFCIPCVCVCIYREVSIIHVTWREVWNRLRRVSRLGFTRLVKFDQLGFAVLPLFNYHVALSLFKITMVTFCKFGTIDGKMICMARTLDAEKGTDKPRVFK